MTVIVDKTKVTTLTAVKACLDAALTYMRGSSGLNP
jgi:hypothetical protein